MQHSNFADTVSGRSKTFCHRFRSLCVLGLDESSNQCEHCPWQLLVVFMLLSRLEVWSTHRNLMAIYAFELC